MGKPATPASAACFTSPPYQVRRLHVTSLLRNNIALQCEWLCSRAPGAESDSAHRCGEGRGESSWCLANCPSCQWSFSLLRRALSPALTLESAGRNSTKPYLL